jgi:hypothetical protein
MLRYAVVWGGAASIALALHATLAPGQSQDLGINVDQYCRNHGHRDGARNVNGTGYGWKCEPGDSDLNIGEACREQYGAQFNAVLLTPAPGQAGDWRCRSLAAASVFGRPEAADKKELIDINSATAQELQTLPGIGVVYSKEIIEGRPYRGRDELDQKKIIPQAIYNKIKDKIKVGAYLDEQRPAQPEKARQSLGAKRTHLKEPRRYEAEAATLVGSAKVNNEHRGYSGTGYVDGYGYGGLGATTTFAVNVPTPGPYVATLRYANGMGAPMTISLYVNETKTRQLTLAQAGSWDSWADYSDLVVLRAGRNSLSYRCDPGDSCNINLDYVDVAESSANAANITGPSSRPLNNAPAPGKRLPAPRSRAPDDGSVAACGACAGLGITGLVLPFVLIISLAIIIAISHWRVFTKAGEPGWAAFVPLYNVMVLARIGGEAEWFGLLMLLPVVNIFIWFALQMKLANRFARGTAFGLGLVFLPMIFYPILAFGDARPVGRATGALRAKEDEAP